MSSAPSKADLADAPLVGRHTEKTAIGTLLQGLKSGHGGSVLAVGEAGIGKSALLRSVLDVADRDHKLIWTAGDELSQVFPLLPFVKAVEGERKAEITALLRGGTGITNPTVAASEVLVEWLDDLCASIPVVLVVDDLHWADAASVRLWNRLTRSAEQLPLLVVGSMRPASDRTDLAALTRRVAELATRRQGVLAALAPLHDHEAAELVGSMVGGAPGTRLTRLIGAAGGNPLHLTELTGALIRDRALATNVGGLIDVADDQKVTLLRSVISSRFDSVPPDVRDLLRIAALLGVEFGVSDLAVASGHTVSELVNMLRRAESAGLLEHTNAGMAFRHPLIRDVLCEEVTGSVRAAWHQEVGRALAQAGQPVSAVARQLLAAVEAGGDLPVSDWLIDWLALQGKSLADQSVTVAKTLFTQALRRMPLTDPQRAAIAVPLAEALLRANDPAESEHLARQTLDTMTARRTDADTALKLGLILVDCAMARAQPHEAIVTLDLLATEMDWEPRHLLRFQVKRSLVYLLANRSDEAATLANDALATARRTGDPWAAASACHVLFLWEIHRRNDDAALRHAERGLAGIDKDPDSVDVYMALLADRAWSLLELHRWEEMHSATAQLRQLAEQTGNERRLQQCVLCDVLRLFNTGNWNDLLSELAGVGVERALIAGYERAVVVCLHRDDLSTARRYLDAVEEILSTAGWSAPGKSEWVAYLRALELVHSGDPQQALDIMLDAVDTLWSSAEVPTAHVVWLAMACDRPADAARVVAFAEAKAPVNLRAGVVPHCRGLLDRDPELLATAAQFYRDRGLALPTAQALEAAGLAWADRGDLKTARKAMIESLAVYESLGAVWDVQRLRAVFREHGLRTGARGSRNRPVSGWQSLTATETKIAHLIATGQSNRMIAEHLFLSRRTVDTHVSHILAKLAVRSRVEVARLVDDQTA